MQTHESDTPEGARVADLPPYPSERDERYGLTFDEWMMKVDDEISGIVGLSSSDLPDIDYMAGWEGGADPAEVAQEALDYAGFEG
jgi:hypothetical protein